MNTTASILGIFLLNQSTLGIKALAIIKDANNNKITSFDWYVIQDNMRKAITKKTLLADITIFTVFMFPNPTSFTEF